MKTQYKYSGPERVYVFEFFVPIKFKKVLQKIMNEFLDPKVFIQSPHFQELSKALDPTIISEEKAAAQLMNVVRGYTLYEAVGRYLDRTSKTSIDEKVVVARMIIREMNRKFKRRRVEYVITNFVGERLAMEMKDELEVWYMEYSDCRLNRLVRK
jgi:hypothetical protein